MNVNDFLKGHAVVILDTAHGNALAANFPGWGAEDYADYLIPLAAQAGVRGVITNVSSHGSNPWTRYTVLLDNGMRAIDIVDGDDFELV